MDCAIAKNFDDFCCGTVAKLDHAHLMLLYIMVERVGGCRYQHNIGVEIRRGKNAKQTRRWEPKLVGMVDLTHLDQTFDPHLHSACQWGDFVQLREWPPR